MSAKNIITFRLDKQLFGIEMGSISEILTYDTITSVPETKEWMVGIMNVRGVATPIIDLRIRFKTNLNPVYNQNTVIIAAKMENKSVVGYIIDEIKDILTIDESDITSQGLLQSAIDAEFVKGYVMGGAQTIIIFDSTKLISQKDKEELLEIGF